MTSFVPVSLYLAILPKHLVLSLLLFRFFYRVSSRMRCMPMDIRFWIGYLLIATSFWEDGEPNFWVLICSNRSVFCCLGEHQESLFQVFLGRIVASSRFFWPVHLSRQFKTAGSMLQEVSEEGRAPQWSFICPGRREASAPCPSPHDLGTRHNFLYSQSTWRI